MNVGFSHITGSQKFFLNDLDEIITLLLDKNIEVTIRNHPSFDDKTIYDNLNKNIKTDNSSTLIEQINNFDFAINFNYLSTSALESMMSLKPVVFYSNAIYFFEGVGSIPKTTDFKVNNPKDLSIFIDNLDNEIFYKEVLKTQNKIINDLVGNDLKISNKKIINILKSRSIKKNEKIEDSVFDFIDKSVFSYLENFFICFYFLGSINYGFNNSIKLLKKHIQNYEIDIGLFVKFYLTGFFSKSFYKFNFSDIIKVFKIKLLGNNNYSFIEFFKFFAINFLVFFKSKINF